MLFDADALEGEGEEEDADATTAEGGPARDRQPGGEPAGGGGSRLGRRCGRTYGCPSADFAPGARAPPHGVDGAGIAIASSYAPRTSSADPRPRIALRGVRGAPAQALAALGVQREVAQRLGQRRRVAARDEHAVAAVVTTSE